MKRIASILLLMILSLSLFSQTKTGTLKIFSELTGISVYVDEVKQTTDPTALIVPIGSHYLKVLYQNTSVYGEIIEIKENVTTTVLIKNTGQVQEKVMETKTPEREEYQNNKVEILLSSNEVSTTTGKSSMFPGYYGYYGFSKSNTVTTQISDFKIIQGGVKEIGDISLARLAENQSILQRNANDNAKSYRMGNLGGGLFLGSLVVGGTIFADMLVEKPFLHQVGTDVSNVEIGTFIVCVFTGIAALVIVKASESQVPAHYYTPDAANKDAQTYDKKLKEKLGLPESYDVK